MKYDCTGLASRHSNIHGAPGGLRFMDTYVLHEEPKPTRDSGSDELRNFEVNQVYYQGELASKTSNCADQNWRGI